MGGEEVPAHSPGCRADLHPASTRFGAAACGEPGAGVVCAEFDGEEREEADEAGERTTGECAGGASPHFGAPDTGALNALPPFSDADYAQSNPAAYDATDAGYPIPALNSAGPTNSWPAGQSPLDIILRASDSPVIHAQAEFAEHFTQDLIQHIHAVTPEYFEQIVADIFTALGFSTEVTGGADDKGVDVIARYSDGLDFAPIYIQVKHYCGTMKVTPNEVQKLAGAVLLHGGLQGVLVTCGAFAHPVPEYLQGLPGARNIALVDQHHLVELMIRHRVGVLDGEGECGYHIDEEYFARGFG